MIDQKCEAILAALVDMAELIVLWVPSPQLACLMLAVFCLSRHALPLQNMIRPAKSPPKRLLSKIDHYVNQNKYRISAVLVPKSGILQRVYT